jgi:hypothetical protein
MTLSMSIPHLRKVGDTQQLVINGKPFLSLAAELQNSSMTSAEYMEPVWQRLVDTNINTVLGCVTWENIEPVEGHFDFAELDKVIMGARMHGLHLVLLWFGSFKNGASSCSLIPIKYPWRIIAQELKSYRYLYLCSTMGQNEYTSISPCQTTQSRRCSENRRRAINLP